MGFEETNSSQKVRISLSPKAMLTIEDDMIAFGTKKITTFINNVIWNFHDIAESSIDNWLYNKRMELEELFNLSSQPKDSPDRASKENAIQLQLNKYEKELLDKKETYKSYNSSSKLYNINNDNYIYLMQECNENKYYASAAKYIKCLLEEYCHLPFIRREQIYRRDIYSIVNNACKNKLRLKVPVSINGKNQLFYVYPYKIMADPLYTQEYLVCYSHPINTKSQKKIASFSMARLNLQGVPGSNTAKLTKKELSVLEAKLSEGSPAYLYGENVEIKVRLTKKGIDSYKTKLYSRPVIDKNKSTEDTFVFYCSLLQAYNYFYPFGKEAEVIEPIELRKRLAESYKEASETYSNHL